MILPKKRDTPHFTARRGGTLQEHRVSLACDLGGRLRTACVGLVEECDPRRAASNRRVARAWARGEITMTEAPYFAFAANAAAERGIRELPGKLPRPCNYCSSGTCSGS